MNNDEQEFLKVKKPEELLAILQEFLRSETLIVWDIDDVLVCPADQILRKSSRSLLHSRISPWKKRGDQYFSHLYSIIWSATSEIRVKGVYDVWKHCSDSVARQIALTSPPGGIYGCIEDLALFRLRRIAELGFDFSQDWTKHSDFVLKDIGSLDKPACFRDGVLFGGTYGKGLILSEFLKRYGQGIRELVFIDDKPENVESVLSAMYGKGLGVCGIHFASEDLSEEIPADEKWAEFQFRHLIENSIWLCDDQKNSFVFGNEKNDFK